MEPFLGEIRIFAGNFAPHNWAFCDGQVLPINQYTALFSLLGATYGGDGRTTFALPDLRERTPIHAGTGPGLSEHDLGSTAGSAEVSLLVTEIPSHSHGVACVGAPGSQSAPTGNAWARIPAGSPAAYADAADKLMAPAVVQPAGGNQPHNNRQPYLGLNFIIALQGIFPSRP